MPDKTTVARVTSVKTKNGRVFVDVAQARPGVGNKGIPFATLSPGLMITPSEGQWVELYETEDGRQARFSHSPAQHSMPELPDESYLHRFNADSEISAIKTPDDTYDVTLAGDNGVTIESAAGNVTVNGNKITVDNGTEKVVVSPDNITVDGGAGTVDILGGTINLGAGSDGVITDVTTTKDADGHVTSIDLTRSSKINIE